MVKYLKEKEMKKRKKKEKNKDNKGKKKYNINMGNGNNKNESLISNHSNVFLNHIKSINNNEGVNGVLNYK